MYFFLIVHNMQLAYALLISFIYLNVLNWHYVKGNEEIYKKIMPAGLKEVFSKAKDEVKNLKRNMESFDVPSFQDLGLTVPPADLNDTIEEDHHTYYKSASMFNLEAAKAYWVDLDKILSEQVITHAMLSDSHRQATTVTLSFDFPFYGHKIRNITIATGGFLYTGDYLHSWIAATQYIAPLMANFDTRLSDESRIKYADNGTAFIVQWDKVHIQNREKDGAFTFQVSLLMNGNIIFAYQDIPFNIMDISQEEHPVKIGISDAYIIERRVFFIRRKTIYEYHRVDLLKGNITNNSAICITALPTCLSHNTCDECLEFGKALECTWCDAVQRCSDGVDRKRQDWLLNDCSRQVNVQICSATGNGSVSNDSSSVVVPLYTSTQIKQQTSVTSGVSGEASISVTSFSPKISTSVNTSGNSIASNMNQEELTVFSQGKIKLESEHSTNPGIILAVVVILAIIGGIGFWVYYAYKFPHSASGQFLIKYRPSQWKVPKGDNGSTTPSLHM